MKTRTGFVSNSSSSSFVIALPSSFDFESKMAEIKEISEEYKEDILEDDETVDSITQKSIDALKYISKTFITWVDGDECFKYSYVNEVVNEFLGKNHLMINKSINGESEECRYFNILADDVRVDFDKMLKNAGLKVSNE